MREVTQLTKHNYTHLNANYMRILLVLDWLFMSIAEAIKNYLLCF